MDDYRDILHLPHHQSDTRAHMSLHDRAAQFAPFAALTGFDEALDETARRTESEMERSEEQEAELNRQLRHLKDSLVSRPLVTVCFFVPDSKKAGGSYHSLRRRVRLIDETARKLVFTDKLQIPLDHILWLRLSDAPLYDE